MEILSVTTPVNNDWVSFLRDQDLVPPGPHPPNFVDVGNHIYIVARTLERGGILK